MPNTVSRMQQCCQTRTCCISSVNAEFQFDPSPDIGKLMQPAKARHDGTDNNAKYRQFQPSISILLPVFLILSSLENSSGIIRTIKLYSSALQYSTSDSPVPVIPAIPRLP
jgi:hypothetical protein